MITVNNYLLVIIFYNYNSRHKLVVKPAQPSTKYEKFTLMFLQTQIYIINPLCQQELLLLILYERKWSIDNTAYHMMS